MKAAGVLLLCCLIASLADSCGFFAPSETTLPRGSFDPTRTEFPADPSITGRIHYRPVSTSDELEIPESRSLKVLKILRRKESIDLYFQSTGETGQVRIRSHSGKSLTLNFYSARLLSDLDGDGFPDSAEFSTEEARSSFREWFVRIAESQRHRRSGRWQEKQRDCSGLIRFSYREALKRHDREWRQAIGYIADGNVSDHRPFFYPGIPVLGKKIFRTGKSAGDFGVFADARSLALFQTLSVGRRPEEALPGDLLFFYNPANETYPYHSMIVVENRESGVIVLYHTGEGDRIKRAPIGYLDASPIYRADPANPHFLGVRRFSILE